MDTPNKEGVTKRAHLEHIAEQRGIVPEALLAPEMPSLYEDCLYLYLEEFCTAGGGLTYVELKAYTEMMEESLSPRQVSQLMEIDYLFLSLYKKKRDSQGDAK